MTSHDRKEKIYISYLNNIFLWAYCSNFKTIRAQVPEKYTFEIWNLSFFSVNFDPFQGPVIRKSGIGIFFTSIPISYPEGPNYAI